ncbi:MAG: CehA/McbA family metallohydrolase, partial [Xanthomonadales bacterium]|nr:CehA/McbA family metallohydrolase [Xanthomonadales bacterium]
WTDAVGTAALWHAVLNLGVPLAASAGSDVMNNLYRTMAIGATRVYVQPRGALTTASYLEALKAGRSFVSTGPLLEFDVSGQGPGGVIESPGESAEWSLQVHSALPVDRVQIFVNGTVVSELEGTDAAGSRQYGGEIDVPSGGWVTARVLGENPGWPVLDSYQYAETSPVWFHAVGSTDAESRNRAAQQLLVELDVKEQALIDAYGNANLPRLRAHFQDARERLQGLITQ